jgi:hypothetical protein
MYPCIRKMRLFVGVSLLSCSQRVQRIVSLIRGQVKPKTQEMVFAALPFSIQLKGVRTKDNIRIMCLNRLLFQ